MGHLAAEALLSPWTASIAAIAAEPRSTAVQPRDAVAHYCIVRADIPPGLQAAQLIHAAGESSPGNLGPGTYAIALSAADERELDGISSRLFRAGIRHCRIVEDDPPWSGQLMAIGIPPRPRRELRRVLSSCPLLR